MVIVPRLRGILLVATPLFSLLDVVDIAKAEYVDPAVLGSCPSYYEATDAKVSDLVVTANLVLAGAS